MKRSWVRFAIFVALPIALAWIVLPGTMVAVHISAEWQGAVLAVALLVSQIIRAAFPQFGGTVVAKK